MATILQVNTAWLQNQLLNRHDAVESNQSIIALTLLALILVPLIGKVLVGGGARATKVPLINPPGLFQLVTQKRFEFVREGSELLREGRRRFPGKPFALITNVNPVTVLPPNRAKEVNDLPTLSFRKAVSSDVPLGLTGFGFYRLLEHPTEMVQKVITKHLTKRLNTVTEPLALETSFAVAKILGNKPDWFEVTIQEAALDIVARLSSRVFLGSDVCRDEKWLEITKNYTMVQNQGVYTMRLFPKFFRPVVYLFDPSCRKTRQLYYQARDIVEPVVAKRRKERQQPDGAPVPVHNDAIEWAESEAAGMAYDPTDFQLILSFAAIHTTTDLICQTMVQLTADPKNVEALRKEMLEVLPTGGWKKASIARLKLLDSAIKEAQRLKPIMMLNMVRRATADVKLEDGIVVPKGGVVVVDSANLHNPELYENPHKYNMYRFADMRKQPGAENKAQLVSLAPEHLPFGYGKYACPGRFFAANEVKMALCHMLLKYDWELAPGTSLEPMWFGTDPYVDPRAKLLCRRRKEEIDLDKLVADDKAEE